MADNISDVLTAYTLMPTQSREQKKVLPKQIGRFFVEDSLGYGAQGIVLLAHDRDLDRRVAIKLLRPSAMVTDADELLDEARAVSQVQHANIVTLYEVGTHRGLPYVVFEYVKGTSLAELLKQEGRLDPAQAVILMSQILAGVGAAHKSDIVHRDLSPSNILVTQENIPKVTDFGLSNQARQPSDGSVRGTLRYLAPERLHGNLGDSGADVFALGAIFFELLTGQHLLAGKTQEEVMATLVQGKFVSTANSIEELHATVAETLTLAVAIDPKRRWPDANAMKARLDTYRIPRDNDDQTPAETHATIEFLLRRMTHAKGFSALSGRLMEVQRISDPDSKASAGQLSNVIAKDVSLTQRVLSLANSASNGRGGISTVSRAVVLMGLRQVRMCINNTLVENHFKTKSVPLQDALLISFFTGALAKEIAQLMKFAAREGPFIAGMFHDLGRSLVIHYFAAEFEAIQNVCAQRELDEISASRQVLGVPYHEIGMCVAKTWGFPDDMIEAMRPLPRGEVAKPRDEPKWIHCYASYASALAHIHRDATVEEIARRRDELVNRGQAAIPITIEQLDTLVLQTHDVTVKYAKLMENKGHASGFLDQLAKWKIYSETQANEPDGETQSAEQIEYQETLKLSRSPAPDLRRTA